MNKSDTHKYTPEQLGAYFDGQLTESERHEISPVGDFKEMLQMILGPRRMDE